MSDAPQTDKIVALLREKDAEAIRAIGHLMEPREITLYRMAADEIERLCEQLQTAYPSEREWEQNQRS